MQPYQQRVVDEHEQLSGRILKLAEFISTEVFGKLPIVEQRRMTQQLAAMEIYEHILSSRILGFRQEV